MTIKGMFDKVKAYNEVAKHVGTKAVELVVTFDVPYGSPLRVNSVKAFTDYVDAEYVKEMADMMKNCKDYEFGVTKQFKRVDRFGWELKDTVEFDIRRVD